MDRPSPARATDLKRIDRCLDPTEVDALVACPKELATLQRM
jgi:hypothetical protein